MNVFLLDPEVRGRTVSACISPISVFLRLILACQHRLFVADVGLAAAMGALDRALALHGLVGLVKLR
jgi:hypothetical protein